MKKLLCTALSALLCLSFAACGKTPDPPPEDNAEIVLADTCSQTVNSLSATDALGRSFSSVSATKERYVGMFYFLWMGQEPSKQSRIYDNTVLLEELGDEYWQAFGTLDSPADQYHYWGEPLFGYYNSLDTWVMRRHMEMITMAGVDFLVFDTTNQFTFNQVWNLLLPIMEEFTRQGFDVPKIAFYTNTDSPTRVTELYSSLYSKGLYKDVWFQPNGKPLIIANNTSALSAEIRNFFDFRASQWPGNAKNENGLPWIDFNEKQEVYANGGAKGGTVMSVSVTQHAGWPFSDSVQFKDILTTDGLSMYNTNYGRGYSRTTKQNNPNDLDSGINFKEQWDWALEKDPSTVFVTGWNEWMAVKFYEDVTIQTGVGTKENLGIPDRRIFLVDTFNKEFSRDIEPMKGGYGDNYYLQLIQNIRKYKGVEGEAFTAQEKTIDIDGDLAQWEDITVCFRDFAGDAVERNCKDAANRSTYTDNSNRNDIISLRVAEDNENLYFLVETAEKITDHEEGDTKWMNLMIGTGENGGFEGFNYILNRTPNGNQTSLEKLKAGYETEPAGSAQLRKKGKYLVLKVQKSALGITGNANLTLKVCDNVQKPNDIMNYYITGDSAPIGRLSYTYKGL